MNEHILDKVIDGYVNYVESRHCKDYIFCTKFCAAGKECEKHEELETIPCHDIIKSLILRELNKN